MKGGQFSLHVRSVKGVDYHKRHINLQESSYASASAYVGLAATHVVLLHFVVVKCGMYSTIVRNVFIFWVKAEFETFSYIYL